jgi:hypothetical protein
MKSFFQDVVVVTFACAGVGSVGVLLMTVTGGSRKSAKEGRVSTCGTPQPSTASWPAAFCRSLIG